jgi:hypothetical protein
VEKELFRLVEQIADENSQFKPKVERLYSGSFSDGYALAVAALTFEDDSVPFGYVVANWGRRRFPEPLRLLKDYRNFLSPEEIVKEVSGRCLSTDFVSMPFALGSQKRERERFSADVYFNVHGRIRAVATFGKNSFALDLKVMTPYGVRVIPVLQADRELWVNRNAVSLFNDAEDLQELVSGILKEQELSLLLNGLGGGNALGNR